MISLQYLILKEIRNLDDTNCEILANDFYEDINNEIEKISNDLQNHNFISLGTVKPDYVCKEVIDLTIKENKDKLKNEILRNTKNQKNNFIEASKNITKEDLEQFFHKISIAAEIQENNNIKRLINRLDEFNKVFDVEIEKALKNSVFEYKIIHILLVEKEKSKYITEKNKCKNRKEKILFHGTNVEAGISIVSSQFFDARTHLFGKGVYFTDSLDYVYYYAGEIHYGNIGQIPEIGSPYSFVASEIYYDNTKLEYVYDKTKKELNVTKNGIRCVYVKASAVDPLNESEILNYNKFNGKEFIITNKDQILPLYFVTIKRVEYLVIWRDYNFNENNPNNYDKNIFDEMQEFHRTIKKFISRELDTKIYYINNDEEAMDLLDRKKYNKIFIITNGNNNGQNFILETRKIIGSEAIAGVSAYSIDNHIHWVKNMTNVLILNGLDFHEKFFRCIINNDINLFRSLKKEIINNYKYIPNFNLKENTQDLFRFPNFKQNGNFSQLTFKKPINV